MNRRLAQVLKIFISICVLIMTVESASISLQAKCKHPTRKMMRKIRSEFFRKTKNTWDDSFAVLIQDKGNIKKNDSKTISVDPTNERCPQKLDEVRESCPHYFVLDVEKNRIPKVILQAKCKCDKCLNFDTGNSDKAFHETYMRCAPVHYYTRVLRVNGCNDDNYLNYEEQWEPVAVGCSCVHARHQTMPKGK